MITLVIIYLKSHTQRETCTTPSQSRHGECSFNLVGLHSILKCSLLHASSVSNSLYKILFMYLSIGCIIEMHLPRMIITSALHAAFFVNLDAWCLLIDDLILCYFLIPINTSVCILLSCSHPTIGRASHSYIEKHIKRLPNSLSQNCTMLFKADCFWSLVPSATATNDMVNPFFLFYLCSFDSNSLIPLLVCFSSMLKWHMV